MRVLFFSDSLDLGGRQRRLTELMKGLYSNPIIQFELVLMSKNIHYLEVLNLGIEIHYLPRKTKKDFSIFNKLYKICKAFKPDILHCWDSMTAIYSVPICRLMGIKLVNGMVVDTPVRQNIRNMHWLRARLTFPFSLIIVGNSYAGLNAYGAPKSKSSCIYNGIDFSRFSEIKDIQKERIALLGNSSSNAFIVGMVAAFEERKDYNTLINAAINLTSIHNNIVFLLVGDGVTLQEMKDKVPQSASSKILFLGKRTDVDSILNVFDVGVLLTNSKVHGEGISNSLIEYMALGKPVIGTRGGGTEELIINGQNGFLINPGNAKMLNDIIEELMQNDSLRVNIGSKGKQTIKDKFDIRIMTTQYIALYKKLLGNK